MAQRVNPFKLTYSKALYLWFKLKINSNGIPYRQVTLRQKKLIFPSSQRNYLHLTFSNIMVVRFNYKKNKITLAARKN